MAIFIIVFLLLRIAVAIIPDCEAWLKAGWQQVSGQFKKRKTGRIFDEHFIEAKAFYLAEFKKLPCIVFIGNIDSAKVFELIKSKKFGQPGATYQRNWYNWQLGRLEFSKTIIKLENKMLIRLGDDWAEILFSNQDYTRANRMIDEFKTMKAPAKVESCEINIITLNGNGLDLKLLPIKPAVLAIDLYYNDDFKAVDETIKGRLAKDNDKGIILLHGLPGTGKTTYLRHLIGSIKKKVLFVSPAVAGNLMNPEFIDLLIDNPNAVLVIEDAENILMDRKYNNGSGVSNLLNISDGLLSDCLNVQIICTFNSALNLIDNALLRKGRLIAKYEFGKLDVQKAKKLGESLGLTQTIDRPMTLAEITNPDETYDKQPAVQVIGFRRHEMVTN